MATKKPTVGIIGAGFSGICAFIQIQKKLGITSQLFELSDDLGGTWYQNTYPGCSCDVPSHLYSLSSEPNPSWIVSYSSQSEILSYIKDVANKHKIYENTQFQTEVVKATWLKEKCKWQLDIKKHDKENVESVYFDILITGLGCLRVPHIPTQFKDFQGETVHTAAWDWSIDYKNKRIAVIGSGSSACQTISFLTENASTLVSYQRSPPWVLPRHQFKFPEYMKWIFAHIPFVMALYRIYIFYMFEMIYPVFGYPNSFLAKNMAKKIEKSQEARLIELNRPDLAKLLKPKYQIGCKRVVFSSDYIDAIARPNASVILSPIKEIREKTIITEDGQKNEFDILVLGTGYKTQQGILGNIKIIGEDGRSLTDEWDTKNPNFYNSTIINGFPNMFMLLGPTTALGHSSVLLMIETQVDYAINCIKNFIFKKNMKAVEPTEEAQDRYMAQWKNDFKGTVWTSSCNSWYKNKSGEITSLYPNTISRFSWTLGKIKDEDYVVYPPRV